MSKPGGIVGSVNRQSPLADSPHETDQPDNESNHNFALLAVTISYATRDLKPVFAFSLVCALQLKTADASSTHFAQLNVNVQSSGLYYGHCLKS